MKRKTPLLALLLALPVAALLLSACGGSDDEALDESTDAAFAAEMVPHHESAIEMAEIAQKRAEHPEVRQLADDIVASQSQEIATLNQISDRIGDENAGTSMGMSSEEMGMHSDPAELEMAKPFDQAFIDMMIPHHQGAITMSHAELANGTDEEAKALAESIIAAQSSEIEQMNEWRTKWYGEPSPAGGVPDNAGASGDHEAMGH